MSSSPPNVSGSEVLLEARDIIRRYPGNVALKGVSFRARRNKINVLIGENGAGKSTLMRILAGIEEPDEGQIFFEGRLVQINSPKAASELGIAIVHQELAVLPTLDVTENIFAGREMLKGGAIINRAGEDRRSGAALNRLRKPLGVRTPTALLSLGSRQLVELARAMAHDARLLILDEPTSALSVKETECLFHLLLEMKNAGVTMVYISHRLHELMHLGDFFTVLRSGNVVGEGVRGEVTRSWIVERMSGHAETHILHHPLKTNEAPIVLRTVGISVSGSSSEEQSQSPVRDVNLTLRKGEIVGIYGLLGAGRTELLEALAGDRRTTAGSIYIDERAVRFGGIRDAVKAGVALVPEDRQRDGLVLELGVRENIALAASGLAIISKTQEIEAVGKLIKQLRIAVRDIEIPVSALSGGNQQKVLLARCLMSSPAILLLDEPTRGVDVGARAEIYHALRELAHAGMAILFSSSEIEEIRLLADRALVMCQGRICADLPQNEITDESLFAMASPRFSSTTNVSLEMNA